MTLRVLGAACTWTRLWTRLYTSGLSEHAREDRRAEIASDVWEHRSATAPNARTGAAIFGRSFAGVPADLTWRIEQSAAPSKLIGAFGAATHGLELCASWAFRRGLPGLTMMVAIGCALLGAGLLASLAAGDPATVSARADGGILFVLTGAFMLSGIELLPSQPRVGLAMVAVPAILMGLILWITVVAPIIAVAVAVSVVTRAREHTRARKDPVSNGTGRQ